MISKEEKLSKERLDYQLKFCKGDAEKILTLLSSDRFEEAKKIIESQDSKVKETTAKIYDRLLMGKSMFNSQSNVMKNYFDPTIYQ